MLYFSMYLPKFWTWDYLITNAYFQPPLSLFPIPTPLFIHELSLIEPPWCWVVNSSESNWVRLTLSTAFLHTDKKTRRQEDKKTWRQEDKKTSRQEEKKTRRQEDKEWWIEEQGREVKSLGKILQLHKPVIQFISLNSNLFDGMASLVACW